MFSNYCLLSVMTLVMVWLGGLEFAIARCNDQNFTSLEENYAITWGRSHVSFQDQGRQIQLSMDKSSGSGFGSKLNYSSGFFDLMMKLPNKDSAGIVTAFYLSSHTSDHTELDFEFLGNREGKPVTLQTNVFINSHGEREQRLFLWFDPTANFHHYQILWNSYQTVFYVDDVPVRVFQNLSFAGVEYLTQPMRIEASIWNGEDWATGGGKEKINWDYAPFLAQFQGFDVEGCDSDGGLDCSSGELWWNVERYRELSSDEKEAYEKVKRSYLYYDYCKDVARFPHHLPPECKLMQ
ncbi:hypothetical protein ZIOFF_071121 [Zingiber officinale]|uniref:Xyloglucan endotransglucosylase/hydrolase n=2 Tax=Zingiber officinale TaxID=94328 RepID=A0A8J5EUA9_ZINOF|nr:hypothetical protein ZIOFF_071121 [Zingiber officinale]